MLELMDQLMCRDTIAAADVVGDIECSIVFFVVGVDAVEEGLGVFGADEHVSRPVVAFAAEGWLRAGHGAEFDHV